MVRRYILVLIPIALLVAAGCGGLPQKRARRLPSDLGRQCQGVVSRCTEAVTPSAPFASGRVAGACRDGLDVYQRAPWEVLTVL